MVVSDRQLQSKTVMRDRQHIYTQGPLLLKQRFLTLLVNGTFPSGDSLKIKHVNSHESKTLLVDRRHKIMKNVLFHLMDSKSNSL